MAKKNYDCLFKLLLIGDSDVGKTSILFKFSDDAFNSTFVSTIGIDFKVKTVQLRDKKIKLQIWDTAGSERFHSITPSYYRGASGILLVYDITKSKSFSSIPKWLRNITEHAEEDVEMILLGNNCHLEESRQVSSKEGEEFARDNGMQFIEVSADETINIESSFCHLVDAILSKTSGKTRNGCSQS